MHDSVWSALAEDPKIIALVTQATQELTDFGKLSATTVRKLNSELARSMYRYKAKANRPTVLYTKLFLEDTG